MQTLPANKLDRSGPMLPNKTTASLYAKKHNPFVLFDDIKNNPARMANVKDYSQLSADLNGHAAPRFVWITPNQCHDMHGGVYSPVATDGSDGTPCPYGSTKDDTKAAVRYPAPFSRSATTGCEAGRCRPFSWRPWPPG